ncbi:heparinase II/III family protein [bacterium]|nr:heparinase II/III family protein [bacterium]
MRAALLLRRLLAMSPAEFAHRSWRLAADRLGYGPARRAAARVEADCLDPLESLFPLDNQANSLWREAGLDSPVLAEAAAVLRGEWELFGRRLLLGEFPAWNVDPSGSPEGRKAARVVAPGLSGSSGADIRAVWELNRLQALVSLGQAFRLSGDSRYAVRAAALIENWSEANPFLRSVNWSNALEAALRAVSLLQAAALCHDSDPFQNNRFRKSLAGLLYLHGHYLHTHLSRGSTALNHLAVEAVALITLGFCLGELPGAHVWRRAGAERLERCLAALVLEDGGPLEGSLHYLAFSATAAVVAKRLAGPHGFELSSRGKEKLALAYRFLCAATDSGRAVSEFGDSDSAAVAGPPAVPEQDRYTRALNLLWLGLENEPLRHSFRPDPDSARLFGARAFVVPPGAVTQPGLLLERFERSGHYVLRAPGFFLRFECGHWGAPPCHAHAHADRLSFSLFIDGLPFLVDPGTGAYLDDPALREYLRSTAAHNTLSLDGRSQAAPRACFFQPETVRSELIEAKACESRQAVLAGRTAALPGREPPLHTRRLTLDLTGRRLVVEDSLTGLGPGSRSVEINFVFQPGCRVSAPQEEKGALRAENGAHCLTIQPDPRCTVSLHRGESAPLRGWFSRTFGQSEPCVQAVLCAPAQGEAHFVSVLRWE